MHFQCVHVNMPSNNIEMFCDLIINYDVAVKTNSLCAFWSNVDHLRVHRQWGQESCDFMAALRRCRKRTAQEIVCYK